jgi:hypothetical protein
MYEVVVRWRACKDQPMVRCAQVGISIFTIESVDACCTTMERRRKSGPRKYDLWLVQRRIARVMNLGSPAPARTTRDAGPLQANFVFLLDLAMLGVSQEWGDLPPSILRGISGGRCDSTYEPVVHDCDGLSKSMYMIESMGDES